MFVARDETLERAVVVKVLSPDLAAGVSAERFTREIKLAAEGGGHGIGGMGRAALAVCEATTAPVLCNASASVARAIPDEGPHWPQEIGWSGCAIAGSAEGIHQPERPP